MRNFSLLHGVLSFSIPSQGLDPLHLNPIFCNASGLNVADQDLGLELKMIKHHATMKNFA